MRSNGFYYLVLFVLTVVDAWLLAHPNLIGRLGIFLYDYAMLETLPKAMATVGITVLVALLLAFGVKKLGKPMNIVAAVALTAMGVYAIFDTYVKFTTGTYQFTGSGFKTGAILLPVILTIIFGKTSIDVIRGGNSGRR